MTKKKESYTYEDFLTETNLNTPTKLPLKIKGKDSGHFFLVSGAMAFSAAKGRKKWLEKVHELNEESKGIDEKLNQEKVGQHNAVHNFISTQFALELIKGWSFGDFTEDRLLNILKENTGLAAEVVNHAFAADGLVQKK